MRLPALRSFRHLAWALSLAPALLIGAGGTADARNIACNRSQVSVPDERGAGNLCISKTEKARAAAICKANGSANWRECTCQDGDTVGACGD